MAISANCVWEIRTTATAANANGGGFVTGASGTDYSQQDAAQYNLTGVTSAGAGNTVLTASAAADMVGNIIHVISGTNFTTGYFEITSVSVGVSITCSTNQASASISTGVGASGVMNIGGAGSSLEAPLVTAVRPANKIWIKAGSYSWGTLTIVDGTGNANVVTEGYNTTRGDAPVLGNRPALTMSAVFTAGAFNIVKNLVFSGTFNGSLLATGVSSQVINCKATMTNAAVVTSFNLGDLTRAMFCEGISTNGVAFNGVRAMMNSCYAHASATGFLFSGNNASMYNCIAAGCTTGATSAFMSNSIVSCVFYNCTTGINTTERDTFIANTIITNCTTGAAGSASFQQSALVDYNVWNNTTDVSNYTKGPHSVTANPQLTDPANGDFTLASNSPAILAAISNGVNNGAVGVYKWNVGVSQSNLAPSGGAAFVG